MAIGLVSEKVTRPATITTGELLALVDSPNRNPAIDAILVRMPLPGHTDAQRARGRIAPETDGDGFSGVNAGAFGVLFGFFGVRLGFIWERFSKEPSL
ncbi:MAG: tetrahydrofolate dehydrogenase/cyclohydrolase catalytic domain-containing protein [Acidobacteriota bacterium]